jgi:hypothetical protein
MTRASVTLAVGFALVAIAIVVTLSGSPLVVVDTNGTPASQELVQAGTGAGACQSGERLPAGISAIRLTLVAAVGPRVSLMVLSGGRVLTGGVAGSGWTSGAVTIPVKPLAHASSGVSVCFTLGLSPENVQMGGSLAPAAVAAQSTAGGALPGRFTVEYMRAGSSSWWSLARTVARHMGLGRAPSGGWVVLLLLALMASALASGSWLAVRELR